MASAVKIKKIPGDIREIAREEIDAASAELCQVPLQHENIHEARRHLKKLRALLRLLRNEIPAVVFENENRSFRDIGRKLAPIRDARVLVRTAESLKKDVKKEGTAIARVIAVLIKREGALKTADARKRCCLHSLDQVRKRVETWPVEKLTWQDLRHGVQETFCRGRQAFRKAAKNPDDEQLHALRKRVKDLEYSFRILKLKRCGKNTCRKIAKAGDYLGEDHDCAVLVSHLHSKKFPLDTEDIQRILQDICKRRSSLQKRALKLSKKIYADKSSRFVGRMIRFK